MKAIVLLNLSLIVLAFLIVSTGVKAGGGQLDPMFECDVTNVSWTFEGDDALLRQDAPSGIAPVPGELSWIRGKVLSLSADSITLQLRASTLKLSIDADTAIIGNSSQKVVPANELEVGGRRNTLAVGTIVQAHYINRHNERRAYIIVDDSLSSAKLSTKPGTSYVGVIEWRAASVQIRGRRGYFLFDSRTRLIDRTGHLLAAGALAVGHRLHVGETVLIIYRTEGSTLGTDPELSGGFQATALEIRQAVPSP